ncbi:ATP-citrate synthase alpha chain [Raphidocelis subcapitata]|uniref:ATP citrate synthase n=1 Tax=Raphidocelis subcapitata TaxID=307507 RepID=A0A2V0P2Z2_9CHLO|nr:ATP-citrate synthase alpha chain [Raphidocelis subcapitata]|eukprot:GBF94241.1 ATP-citrate synthase alpha chain [Raphidocelis subcapitata]
MARKKVREYTGKRLLREAMKRIAAVELPINVAQVTQATNYPDLLAENPWLNQVKLVVKPDMLFGQRGKNDLVGLNLSFDEAEAFIRARMNKEVVINGLSGPVTTFVVEPFVPHEEEYYLSIQSGRLGCDVSFSTAGGVEIEENWDKVKSVELATGQAPTSAALAPLVASLPLELRPKMEAFIRNCYEVFDDLDCSMLEMNPFTLDPKSGQPFPLDIRMELDDTAAFRNGPKWGEVEFPLPFGRTLTAAESYVAGLDEATGASLKFTVLNPRGRVWLMVAGGGASVIYADTVGDLGWAQELGNYGEYSGAPNTQETYQYARTVIQTATANPDGRGRALLIGGGIANFTDVAATFKGIIRALREQADAIKAAKLRLFVRRGGPNYQTGLAAMQAVGAELDIPVEVFGPEASMTGICARAIDYIKVSAS